MQSLKLPRVLGLHVAAFPYCKLGARRQKKGTTHECFLGSPFQVKYFTLRLPAIPSGFWELTFERGSEHSPVLDISLSLSLSEDQGTKMPSMGGRAGRDLQSCTLGVKALVVILAP